MICFKNRSLHLKLNFSLRKSTTNQKQKKALMKQSMSDISGYILLLDIDKFQMNYLFKV